MSKSYIDGILIYHEVMVFFDKQHQSRWKLISDPKRGLPASGKGPARIDREKSADDRQDNKRYGHRIRNRFVEGLCIVAA